VKICNTCGYQYPDSEAFCGNCGNVLVGGQPVPMGVPQLYIQQPAYQIKPLPEKKHSNWKIWIGAIEVLIGFFLLICFCMIPYETKLTELNTLPEQATQVEVIKTDRYYNDNGPDSYYIYFKFPDNIEKIFNVNYDTYKNIQKGETGTLFYKERSNKESAHNRLFIRFEKD